MPRGPTSLIRRKLIRGMRRLARQTGRSVWRRVAEELSRPRRRRVAVNISRINRYAREGETVVVPGKVLGAGKLEKKLTVIAESFSETALKKIVEAGGKAIPLTQVLEDEETLKTYASGPLRIMV